LSNAASPRERFHAASRLARVRALKLARILVNRDYRRGLRQGVAASVEHAEIPFSGDIATVIDLGASRGQFALFATSRFPDARVISFEPQPGPLAELQNLLGDRVETRPVAVGAEAGRTTMNISQSDDSSSLLEIGADQRRVYPGTEKVDTLEVEVTTLDEALDLPPARPCLLKIDVQGLELDVLRGATKTLAQVDEALIECSFIELYEGQAMADQVIGLMLESGFRLAGVYGAARDAAGQMVQADFFFRRAGER